MKRILYGILQITWGFPQTFFGFAVFLWFRKGIHYRYHGAVVTEWNKRTGLSLGMFVFIPEGNTGKTFLVHEYGHTVQSLLLGPFYLLFVGIPSVVWCNFSLCDSYRRKKKCSYGSLYTECWANRLGEKSTGERAQI